MRIAEHLRVDVRVEAREKVIDDRLLDEQARARQTHLAGIVVLQCGLGRRGIEKYFQAAGGNAEQRVRIFRLAWDFVGSDLGGRGELYERFYLSDSWRMTQLAYRTADTTFAESLVEQFMHD